MIYLLLFLQISTGGPYYPEYYVFPSSDQVLMEVQLWGHVSKPGLYQVPLKTDIVKLISLAGGPLPSANLKKVTILRKGENKIVDINRVLNDSDMKVYLEPGDVVIVPQNTSSKFKNLLTFLREGVTIAAQVVLIYTFLQAQK